jgi:carotenoid cleavage dioxygenase-like enzyme
VFVPSPGAHSEDEGVLLSVVLNAESRTSYLLVLNASTMKEVGKAFLSHSILFGYHGTFLTQHASNE